MGDMNNNPNGGNEIDNTPFTPDNQESTDLNPNDSFRQGSENEAEPITYEETTDEKSPYEQSSYNQSSYEQPSYGRPTHEQSYETTAEPVSPKKPKTKLIAAVVIAAIILCGAIYALTSGSLANTIALMTKSPAEYYSSIEKQGINEGIDAFTTSYEKYVELYNQQKNTGVAQDADVKVTVNPQFTSLIGLPDFQSIEAKISTIYKGTNEKTTMGISYNNQSLLNFNAFLNSETSDLYLNVPELSTAYLLYSLDDLMSNSGESMYGYDSREYTKKIEELITNDAVSPKTLNTMLKKYSSILVDNLTNVKLEKNVSITASELKGNYNKLTAEITEKDLRAIASAILKEATNDEDLKNLLVALEVCTKDEYADSLNNAMKELEDNSDISTDDPLYMHVYVDKNGKIMGREFTSSEKEATGGGYYLVSNGNKVGFTAWVKENGKNIVDCTADGSVSTDGFNGKLAFNVTDNGSTSTFNVDVENAKTDTDKGSFNGKFTLSSDLLMGAGIVFDCKGDSKEQNMKFQVTYGGMEAATIDITSKKGEYKDFEFPPTDGEVYDGNNDMYSYWGTADIEGLFTRIQDVTGLDLSSLLESYLSNSTY